MCILISRKGVTAVADRRFDGQRGHAFEMIPDGVGAVRFFSRGAATAGPLRRMPTINYRRSVPYQFAGYNTRFVVEFGGTREHVAATRRLFSSISQHWPRCLSNVSINIFDVIKKKKNVP